MKSANPNVVWACGTVLLLAIIGGLFALVWVGKLPGVAVLSALTPIAAAVLVALGVKTTIVSAVNAKLQAPPQ